MEHILKICSGQMFPNLFQKGTNVPKFVLDKFLNFVPKMEQILKICS